MGHALQFQAPKTGFLRKCFCVGSTLVWVTQPPPGAVIPLFSPTWPPHPGSHFACLCGSFGFLQSSFSPPGCSRPGESAPSATARTASRCSPSLDPSAQPPAPPFQSKICQWLLAWDTHTLTHIFFFLLWLTNQHLMPGSLLPSPLITPTQPLELSPPPGRHPWLFLLGWLKARGEPAPT